MKAEHERLEEAREQKSSWKKWGPYLSERQWGTVREDYSEGGDVWNYFTHDQARSRAYRWGEDGIAGLSDDKQRLCFALALWNRRDPILKERIFGLTNREAKVSKEIAGRLAHPDLHPQRAGPAPGLRRHGKVSDRSPPRSYPVLRILPRRQWSGAWRKPPDRLDRARGQIYPALRPSGSQTGSGCRQGERIFKGLLKAPGRSRSVAQPFGRAVLGYNATYLRYRLFFNMSILPQREAEKSIN